jgi:hypothetical protein
MMRKTLTRIVIVSVVVVTLAVTATLGVLLSLAEGGSAQACPDNGWNNATGVHYYWVFYSNSTGSVVGLQQGGPGAIGQPDPGPGQSVLNISSNMSLVLQIACDAFAGHLSYWHVDLATKQLMRTT